MNFENLLEEVSGGVTEAGRLVFNHTSGKLPSFVWSKDYSDMSSLADCYADLKKEEIRINMTSLIRRYITYRKSDLTNDGKKFLVHKIAKPLSNYFHYLVVPSYISDMQSSLNYIAKEAVRGEFGECGKGPQRVRPADVLQRFNLGGRARLHRE